MVYDEYLKSQKDLQKIINLLMEQRKQILTELETYSFQKNSSVSDFRNYFNLVNINNYYSMEIANLIEKKRIARNTFYKNLSIEKNGNEDKWRGVIL